MDCKEEKKERRPGYFARLKKKKQPKPSAEGTLTSTRGTSACQTQLAAQDTSNEVLKQIASEQNTKAGVEKGNGEEEKKKKKSQAKQIRRTELKRYYSTDDPPTKNNERKEKKMVIQKPPGTTEYTAASTDTLNSIALKFNVTPNKLVELNRLFTHTIVPGQVLYVPATHPCSVASTPVPTAGGVLSASSSDAEYDKLPDADLARVAKPIERVLSSTSEEEEPVVVKFLKMNCRYITDGKGVVGGVMIVTPNNVMFDPHKSDPLVIENGVEEYGLICPMDEVVSIALYSDISHMKIKDALPSPGEWEDLSSEKDINPFSKFKSLNKEKRQQNGTTVKANLHTTFSKLSDVDKATGELENVNAKGEIKTLEHCNVFPISVSKTNDLPHSCTKKVEEPFSTITISEPGTKERSPLEDGYIELEKALPPVEGGIADSKETVTAEVVVAEPTVSQRATEETTISSIEAPLVSTVLQGSLDIGIPENLCLNLNKESELSLAENDLPLPTTEKMETMLKILKDLSEDQSSGFVIDTSKTFSSSHSLSNCNMHADKNILVAATETASEPAEVPEKIPTSSLNADLGTDFSGNEALFKEGSPAVNRKVSEESPLSYSSGETFAEMQQDSETEIKLWLLKRMQGPIEDMLPSKEEKSKTPPMFLCIKVGKPMRKSFNTQSAVMVQQYARKRKQPEYWFAVPRERVDHLYTFFVQWSPEVYGKDAKDAKDQGFVVVEKDELDMIDNFFSEPTTKSWEIITVEEAKRRKSVCSLDEEDTEEFLPDLRHNSALLEDVHVEKLAQRLPARVQGYPWRLVYSTLEHGTSLKTLYRKTASIDSPVLLVIKDMDNQVFGAYATHPFKFSDHYYGTGETFLYTFTPDFKVFKWTGDNSYFINGDLVSLELGGGSGGFGLWLDADLYHGRSKHCETFNNETLSKKEDFIVQDVEVWTFE
ncbi:nuclear receptor coactivator 7 isoform X2 [Pleurodeles waltl]|uniref:nuclear receptor coactivator 7 isoform X2 n=1 Tax=Pleurodeles waltl TaxID=8319 RepID=UPI003709A144